MTKKQLEHFKKILFEEKQEITQNLIQQSDNFSKLQNPSAGDIADLASQFSEKQILIGLSASEQKTLKAIEQALKKIEDQTFGLCESCSQVIEENRLQAIPYADLCINCKKKRT